MKITHKRTLLTSGVGDPFAARTNWEDFEPIPVLPASPELKARFDESARTVRARRAIDLCHHLARQGPTTVERRIAQHAVERAARGDHTNALMLLNTHERRTNLASIRAVEA
jgi:hypothetical protein